ncbi:hypothetical protein [Mycobacterium ulcerans]|uniref:hypothetical protein n=2 Tax=Mycobacterium ulcerans TaxID=1809 RepID=UPI0018D5A499|nr:hypothetical protein [Mycobacterium ulcerans]
MLELQHLLSGAGNDADIGRMRHTDQRIDRGGLLFGVEGLIPLHDVDFSLSSIDMVTDFRLGLPNQIGYVPMPGLRRC